MFIRRESVAAVTARFVQLVAKADLPVIPQLDCFSARQRVAQVDKKAGQRMQFGAV